MTPTQNAWLALYAANARANGAQTATITRDGAPVTTSKRAIISELTMDEVLAAGGTAENGGYNIQMLATDFAQPPAKFDTVEIFSETIPLNNGTLELDSPNLNNGIWYLKATDFVAHES